MMIFLLYSAFFFPLLLAAASFWRKLDALTSRLFCLGALPALILALNPAPVDVRVPDLLLASHIGLDPMGRAFLLLTAIVWLGAGLYSYDYIAGANAARRYRFFFLCTCAGNLGVCLALDAASFYTAFALMTIAGYGLVTHTQTGPSLTAGRFYLGFALPGELLIFSGIILAAAGGASLELDALREATQASPTLGWICALFFVGFGIKTGFIPLHAWLPRSYYAAPLPATAVLSGAMSKAGLLGWLRFMPLAEGGSTTWSIVMMAFGMWTALYAAILGIMQTRARTALAISSLSQMGYICVIVGAGLALDAPYEATLSAALAFMFHHGVTKAGMFLGVDLLGTLPHRSWQHRLVLATLVFASLSLVGLPLTSGALAKHAMKFSGGELWHMVAWGFLALAGCGTALLLIRFAVLAARLHGDRTVSHARWLGWASMSALTLLGAPLLLKVLEWTDVGSSLKVGLINALLSVLPSLILAIVFGWILRRVLFRESQRTPRPFEGLFSGIQDLLSQQIPTQLQQMATLFTGMVRREVGRLRIGERSQELITSAASLSTSWRLATAFMLATWFALWILLEVRSL